MMSDPGAGRLGGGPAHAPITCIGPSWNGTEYPRPKPKGQIDHCHRSHRRPVSTDMVAMIASAIGDRQVPRWTESDAVLAINFGDQIGATAKTAAHHRDLKSSSGGLRRTGKTQWTSRTALRSRWHRFESCRGRKISRPQETTADEGASHRAPSSSSPPP